MLDPSEYDEFNRQYEYHQSAAAQHRKQMAEEERLASGHEMIVQGLVRLYPDLEKPRVSDEPSHEAAPSIPELPTQEPPASPEPTQLAPGYRGSRALEALLGGQPMVFYSSAGIHEMLLEHGWADPGPDGQAAVRANINRAVNNGVMVKRPHEGRGNEYAWAAAHSGFVNEGMKLMDPSPFRPPSPAKWEQAS